MTRRKPVQPLQQVDPFTPGLLVFCYAFAAVAVVLLALVYVPGWL